MANFNQGYYNLSNSVPQLYYQPTVPSQQPANMNQYGNTVSGPNYGPKTPKAGPSNRKVSNNSNNNSSNSKSPESHAAPQNSQASPNNQTAATQPPQPKQQLSRASGRLHAIPSGRLTIVSSSNGNSSSNNSGKDKAYASDGLPLSIKVSNPHRGGQTGFFYTRAVDSLVFKVGIDRASLLSVVELLHAMGVSELFIVAYGTNP